MNIEYKSGTMTSKVNGDVIHVTDVEPVLTSKFAGEAREFRVATEVATDTRRMYILEKWDFEPDKISIYDLFDSFDVGTKFLWINHNGDRMERNFESGDEYYWLKVGVGQMVYTSSRGEVVYPLYGEPILRSRQNLGKSDTIEAI